MELSFSLYSQQDADLAIEALAAIRPLLVDLQSLPQAQFGQPFPGYGTSGYVQAVDPDSLVPVTTNGSGEVTLPTESFTKEDAQAAMEAIANEAAEQVKAKRTRRSKAEIEAAKAAEEAAKAATEPTVEEEPVDSLEALIESSEAEEVPAAETEESNGYDDLMAVLGLAEEEPAEFAGKSDEDLRRSLVERLKDRANYGPDWVARVLAERNVKRPGELTRGDLIYALQSK
jgi:hypothetical protein